ncbi:GIN domain-containing protein [Sediminibacterium ginsengisoli]|uniref:Putative auto-transporter adhesin head GIN domain-containing protein n=1 Tax=Sediminibacterium ginsengisoli TaxID=413434 RepID=A0A1T4JXT3_9BACT|nr:DUF2807 domain-containing protein [Sediminibacterium ginsengisoli]SJZ34919.1 hypothetical protein SAMN04488132_101290 [Sediminibacterium ginsengisoli]
MKKSNLTITLALLMFVATLATANFKIQSEYKNNRITPVSSTRALPAFSHIVWKENITNASNENYRISVNQGSKSEISSSFSEEELPVTLTVRNDTLYILAKDSLEKRYSAFLGDLYTAELKSITASNHQISLKGDRTQILAVSASGKAEIKLADIKVQQLDINAADKASVAVTGTDTIPQANISIGQKSRFSASDVFFANNLFSAGDSATIQLSGRAMKSFNTGLKKP